MIKLTNLKKSFGDLVVLDGINLDVQKGQVVAIIGPSYPVNPPCCAV